MNALISCWVTGCDWEITNSTMRRSLEVSFPVARRACPPSPSRDRAAGARAVAARPSDRCPVPTTGDARYGAQGP